MNKKISVIVIIIGLIASLLGGYVLYKDINNKPKEPITNDDEWRKVS